MTKLIWTALAAVLLLADPVHANDQVSLRLNWYLGGFHTPFYLGAERGFYRDAGIDLTINEGRGSANTVQVIASGSDTFGIADSSSVMLLAARGADIKTVMSLQNGSPYGIISLAGSGITKINDLEGKRLAISAGDALTQLFPAVAKYAKLDMSKVTVVQIDAAGKVVALLEHRVDAIIGGLDDQYFLVKQRGGDPIGFSFADNGVRLVGLTVISQLSTISAHPDLVRRFVAATQKAWEAAKADPDAAVAAAMKVQPGLNAASQKAQLLEDISLLETPATAGKPLGTGALLDWASSEALLKQYRDLKTDKPAEAFFTNEFLPQ